MMKIGTCLRIQVRANVNYFMGYEDLVDEGGSRPPKKGGNKVSFVRWRRRDDGDPRLRS